jgi:hypothetical protein
MLLNYLKSKSLKKVITPGSVFSHHKNITEHNHQTSTYRIIDRSSRHLLYPSGIYGSDCFALVEFCFTTCHSDLHYARDYFCCCMEGFNTKSS